MILLQLLSKFIYDIETLITFKAFSTLLSIFYESKMDNIRFNSMH